MCMTVIITCPPSCQRCYRRVIHLQSYWVRDENERERNDAVGAIKEGRERGESFAHLIRVSFTVLLKTTVQTSPLTHSLVDLITVISFCRPQLRTSSEEKWWVIQPFCCCHVLFNVCLRCSLSTVFGSNSFYRSKDGLRGSEEGQEVQIHHLSHKRWEGKKFEACLQWLIFIILSWVIWFYLTICLFFVLSSFLSYLLPFSGDRCGINWTPRCKLLWFPGATAKVQDWLPLLCLWLPSSSGSRRISGKDFHVRRSLGSHDLVSWVFQN